MHLGLEVPTKLPRKERSRRLLAEVAASNRSEDRGASKQQRPDNQQPKAHLILYLANSGQKTTPFMGFLGYLYNTESLHMYIFSALFFFLASLPCPL